MHTVIRTNRLYSILAALRHSLFLSAAGTLGLYAQQSAGTASSLPPG